MNPPLGQSQSEYDLIRQFLLKKASRNERLKAELNPDTALDEKQIIDSFGVLELIAYLEETFHIRIARKEITLDNFKTINRILALVHSKR